MMEEPVHIMVVEDNPYDAEFIVRAFNQCNGLLRAKILTDGHEALQHIPAVCADPYARSFLRLVLLDLKLPKVHGLEVLRRLRAEDTAKELPIVVFTSSSDERDRVASREYGANGYVVKPVGFGDFLNVVGEIYTNWVEEC